MSDACSIDHISQTGRPAVMAVHLKDLKLKHILATFTQAQQHNTVVSSVFESLKE